MGKNIPIIVCVTFADVSSRAEGLWQRLLETSTEESGTDNRRMRMTRPSLALSENVNMLSLVKEKRRLIVLDGEKEILIWFCAAYHSLKIKIGLQSLLNYKSSSVVFGKVSIVQYSIV